MNNQKGFAPIAIILIIIGALAFGGGAFYVKEKRKTEEIRNKQADLITQDQKQKTYRNDTNGFSFEYPSTLVLTEKGPNEITLNDLRGTSIAHIDVIGYSEDESANEGCVVTKYEIGAQKIPGSKEVCSAMNTEQINYIIPLSGGIYLQFSSPRDANDLLEDIVKTVRVDFYNQKEISFITPVASESLVRGNSHVVIWDGYYPRRLTLKVLSTSQEYKTSFVVSEDVSSLNQRNQIVWNVPCDFDNSRQYWYKLALIDKSTNKTIGESPAFIISKIQLPSCAVKK